MLTVLLVFARAGTAYADWDTRWDRPKYLWHASRMGTAAGSGTTPVLSPCDYYDVALMHRPPIGLERIQTAVYDIDWVSKACWSKRELCEVAASRGLHAMQTSSTLVGMACNALPSTRSMARSSSDGGTDTTTLVRILGGLMLLIGFSLIIGDPRISGPDAGDSTAAGSGPVELAGPGAGPEAQTDIVRPPTNLAELGLLLLLIGLALMIKAGTSAKPSKPVPDQPRKCYLKEGADYVEKDPYNGTWSRVCIYDCPEGIRKVSVFIRSPDSETGCDKEILADVN